MTVETVIALAAEQNPAEISTIAVAKRMGVTQGALFRHFASKDAILEAVMEWVAGRLLARVDEAAAAAGSPLAALRAVFMAHIGFIAEHPGVPRLLFGELQRAGPTPAKTVVHALIERYAGRLGRLVAEGRRRGELRTTLDERAAATMFIGMIQGLVVQSLLAGDVGRIRANAEDVFALYRRAIEVTP